MDKKLSCWEVSPLQLCFQGVKLPQLLVGKNIIHPYSDEWPGVTHLWGVVIPVCSSPPVGHLSLWVNDYSSLGVIHPWGLFIPGGHSSLSVTHLWRVIQPRAHSSVGAILIHRCGRSSSLGSLIILRVTLASLGSDIHSYNGTNLKEFSKTIFKLSYCFNACIYIYIYIYICIYINIYIYVCVYI